MEFDRTKIVIRQRSLLEIADLTIVIMREYWRPLLLWAFLGALPFALLNQFVLFPVLQYTTLIMEGVGYADEGDLRSRYYYLASVLVFLEAPFALQGLTFFLGEAVFVERPGWKSVVKYLRSSMIRCIIILGILRGGLLGIVAVLMIPSNTTFFPAVEVFLIGFLLLGGSYAIRSFRPFAPEILMLERCPLYKKKGGDGVSYGQRSNWLHTAVSGLIFGRMLFMAALTIFGAGVLLFCEGFITGTLFGDWSPGWLNDWILWPLNMWIIATFTTVFRFLSYLDCRIRMEGWEVQLRMKAEAARLGVMP